MSEVTIDITSHGDDVNITVADGVADVHLIFEGDTTLVMSLAQMDSLINALKPWMEES